MKKSHEGTERPKPCHNRAICSMISRLNHKSLKHVILYIQDELRHQEQNG